MKYVITTAVILFFVSIACTVLVKHVNKSTEMVTQSFADIVGGTQKGRNDR